MNIKSNEYQLTKKEFFKICLLVNFKRLAVLAVIYLILFDAAVFLKLLNAYWLVIVIAVFVILIPVISVLSLLFYLNSKANKIFYKKKRFEIDDDFLTTYLEDGSFGKIKLDSVVKIIKTYKYYMLFISQAQFQYLPKSAFLSEQDIKSFEDLLKNKKLLKNKS